MHPRILLPGPWNFAANRDLCWWILLSEGSNFLKAWKLYLHSGHAVSTRISSSTALQRWNLRAGYSYHAGVMLVVPGWILLQLQPAAIGQAKHDDCATQQLICRANPMSTRVLLSEWNFICHRIPLPSRHLL